VTEAVATAWGKRSVGSGEERLQSTAASTGSCRQPEGNLSARFFFLLRHSGAIIEMTLAVHEVKDEPGAALERVVEYRAGWFKMDYQYRGDAPALQNLNAMEFVGAVGFPQATNPSQPELRNYRYYLDTMKFFRAAQDAAADAATAAEMRAMPAGADVATYLLEHFQLGGCAQCGARGAVGAAAPAAKGVPLLRCTGCRSFAYCCREHQKEHWAAEHKYVCLKRKSW
jgi:hypothetical protein